MTSTRADLLARIDTLVGEVETLVQRADEYRNKADDLEREAKVYRQKHDDTYVTIRKTNSEIDKLIAELRRGTA